jgi:hypothetical protein
VLSTNVDTLRLLDVEAATVKALTHRIGAPASEIPPHIDGLRTRISTLPFNSRILTNSQFALFKQTPKFGAKQKASISKNEMRSGKNASFMRDEQLT